MLVACLIFRDSLSSSDDTDCEAFKACRPEDGDECLQLIPGTVATAPAAPVTA